MWLIALLLLLAAGPVTCTAPAPADLLFAAHFDASSDAEWGGGDRASRPAGTVTDGGGGRFGEALSLEGKRTVAFRAPGNLKVGAGAIEMWVCPHWQGDDGVARTFFDARWGERQWLRVNKIAANSAGVATIAGSDTSYRRVDDDVSAWKPVPTRHWEAYREGAEDARTFCYLEDLASEAKERSPEAARRAETWLAELRALQPSVAEIQGIDQESPVLVAVSRRFGGADYQRLRRRTAEEIIRLRGVLGK